MIPAHNQPPTAASLTEAARVVVAAAALRGDMEQAMRWFHNIPISELGHRTAAELVAAGKAAAVLDYLDSIASGATG